jgi:transposase-like protein
VIKHAAAYQKAHMSLKKKKTAATGIRYSDEQKKEIVDFVLQHNKSNGRGGQSMASKKFKVNPLTISSWLQSTGSASTGKKETKSATKNAKAEVKVVSGERGMRGVRYPEEFKREIVEFATAYNELNGRGGQNQAAKNYNLSVITVAAWLKAAGVKKPGKKKISPSITPIKNGAKQVTSSATDLAAFKAALIKLINSF